MNQLFNMDNPVFRVMGKVMDLIILNLFFIACCIPIVTIGPSLTALYYVTLKMVRNEEGYIMKGFFKSFRQNLKQGILINLLMLGFGFFLGMDFRILNAMTSPHRIVFFLLLFVLVVYVLEFLYLYPVLAKFDNTIKNTLLNSLMMSISHLPYTALILFITVAPFLVLYFTPIQQVQSLLLLFLILLGGAGIAYCNSYFFVKIFDKYIPAEDKAASAEDLAFSAEIPEEAPESVARMGEENALPDGNEAETAADKETPGDVRDHS